MALYGFLGESVKLLIFPECALTGYPPYDIEKSSKIKFKQLALLYDKIQTMAINYDIYIITGTIVKENDKYYDSAGVFSPKCEKIVYHKRALRGWYKDNFCVGNNSEIFNIEAIKRGIRICFEVRFPEFFRE